MERGVKDGYMVGRVERVDDWEEEIEVGDESDSGHGDEPPEPSSSSGASHSSVQRGRRAPTNDELMAVCRDFVQELTEGTPWVGQHLNTNYIPMPTDTAAFSFWIAPVSG